MRFLEVRLKKELSNEQKALIKCAQRAAGVGEEEYRETLAMLAGVNSTRDAGWTDANFDKIMKWFERLFWRGIDAGEIAPPRWPKVFRVRNFWLLKNTAGESSRQRFAAGDFEEEIQRLESALMSRGKGANYLAAIARNCRAEIPGGPGRCKYLGALKRTLERAAQPVGSG